MLDKLGYVWRAPANSGGSYDLERQPLAHLGPGRPLGFHFDADGNLIVCNSGAVTSSSLPCHPICMISVQSSCMCCQEVA